jgi:hypothetical protein
MLSFDAFNWSDAQPRWNVLWLETRLDCRTWAYYCDLRRAFGKLHNLWPAYKTLPAQLPDLIVVGPRFTTNNYHAWDPLGVSRRRLASVPLLVLQNKLYDCRRPSMVGIEPPLPKSVSWLRLDWSMCPARSQAARAVVAGST